MENEEILNENIEKNTKKKSKNFLEFIQNHPKLVFWVRFALWTIFACISPIVFLVIRFDLLHSSPVANLGFWGVVILIIAVIFSITILFYVAKVIARKNVFVGQCITGFCFIVLPLITLMVLCFIIKENIAAFIQVLGYLAVTELIAIPLNPLPEWAAQSQSDVELEKRKSTIDYMIDKFFKRKKEDE